MTTEPKTRPITGFNQAPPLCFAESMATEVIQLGQSNIGPTLASIAQVKTTATEL